jgi:hypothetical protein
MNLKNIYHNHNDNHKQNDNDNVKKQGGGCFLGLKSRGFCSLSM